MRYDYIQQNPDLQEILTAMAKAEAAHRKGLNIGASFIVTGTAMIGIGMAIIKAERIRQRWMR